MFATDRDLLVYEPNLFRDFVWLGQRLVFGAADVNEGTLTFYPEDNSLAAAGIDAGHVVTVAGANFEVIERTGENEAVISRLRPAHDGPSIPPNPAESAAAWVQTFSPQLARAHHRVLRLVGIEPLGTPVPGQPTESQITNARALGALECFAALELIFRAAGSLLDDTHPANQRARLYAAAFETERERLVALIDTNADGTPDTARRLNGSPLIRG